MFCSNFLQKLIEILISSEAAAASCSLLQLRLCKYFLSIND